MNPTDKKKAELEKDPEFAKIVKSLKMKAPLQQIIQKVKAEGRFQVEDVLLFASEGEKAKVKKLGLLAVDAPKSAADTAAEKKERQERMAKAAIEKLKKAANKPMTMLEQINA